MAEPGNWTCSTHGVVDPDRSGRVPSCPRCGAMAMRVEQHEHGYLVYVQPAPEWCAGPGRHPLGAGLVTLHWRGCLCPPALRDARGHTMWRCLTCGDVQEWPPHEDPTR